MSKNNSHAQLYHYFVTELAIQFFRNIYMYIASIFIVMQRRLFSNLQKFVGEPLNFPRRFVTSLCRLTSSNVRQTLYQVNQKKFPLRLLLILQQCMGIFV